MKNTRILFVVLALVLVVSLVACGGEKTPDVTEAPATTTEAPAVTTEAPAVTTEAPAVTTEAPAVTTEAPAVTTEAPKDFVPVDYDTLYVGYNAETGSYDDAYLIVNFETGDTNYKYRSDNAIALSPSGSSIEQDDAGKYYLLTASSTGNVYIQNLFDKYTYPTVADGNKEYTVEFVLQDTVEATAEKIRDIYLNLGFTTRFVQRATATGVFEYTIGSTSRAYIDRGEQFFAFNKKMNTYSVTFDIGEFNAVAYYNGLAAALGTATTEETFKLAAKPSYKIMANNLHLYEVRVYSRALTAEEVAQNHFADIAKYLELDLSAFSVADEDAKLGVYSAFQSYSIDSVTKEEAQEIIDFMLS